MNTAIIVHGGAGGAKQNEEKQAMAIAACREAAAAGQAILVQEGSALDAVEAAVRILEDSPVLDAGRGSCLNANGEIEMDAIIVDGLTLNLGAVGAIQHILHPITLARRIMNDSKHNFLVCAGADAFAEEIGFPRCTIEELLVADEVERYKQFKAARDSMETINEETLTGTVGAVALDVNRNLAAATSTGGTRFKKAGRIGDSPLIGSGAYADNWTAAASATGDGESLMKIVIAKRVCDFIAGGLSAQEACKAAISILAERVQGSGGVIALDPRGGIGWAFNTEAMPHAYVKGDGEIESGH